jgi:hypothetical protein
MHDDAPNISKHFGCCCGGACLADRWDSVAGVGLFVASRCDMVCLHASDHFVCLIKEDISQVILGVLVEIVGG